MRLYFTVDEKIELSFLPFSFFLLEDLLGTYKIQSINRLNFGFFDEGKEPLYIDLDSYKDIIGDITTIKDIVKYFSKYEDDEYYSIYKLGLDFEGFSVLYDDDSFIKIESNDIGQYNLFHEFYLQLFDLYIRRILN